MNWFHKCSKEINTLVCFQWPLCPVVDAVGCSFSDVLSLVSESEAESES